MAEPQAPGIRTGPWDKAELQAVAQFWLLSDADELKSNKTRYQFMKDNVKVNGKSIQRSKNDIKTKINQMCSKNSDLGMKMDAKMQGALNDFLLEYFYLKS